MNYYTRYYKTLLKGKRQAPRGHPITRQINVALNVAYGTTFRRAHDNPAIGFMEGLMFLAGTFDHKNIERVAPRAHLELFTRQSAYGPRVGTQLERVINALNADRETRQAVIVLADPNEELSERPCVTNLQFLLDDLVCLTMTVTMRSSDAVWGLPYDLIQCGIVHQAVCYCTGLCPGRVTFNIGNAHVYEETRVPGPFSTWQFNLPKLYDTVQEWKLWAAKLADVATREGLYEIFDFREVKNDSYNR